MKSTTRLALILVFLTFILTAVISRSTFDRLPHLEDEFAYLFQAGIFEKGDVYIDLPQPNRAYWQPFLINLDQKRFSKYPPGWSMLLASGTATDTPWVVNMWFAGLTVALVYRFGREMFDEVAGLVGALLMTISPIALLLNGTLMSHTTTLFFTMLFIYAMWRLERGQKRWLWAALGGAGLGIVIASRPIVAPAVAGPLIIYSGLRLLWLLMAKRREFLPALRPMLLLAVMTVVFAAPYPIYNYVVAGSPTENLYTHVWDYDRIGFGPGIGRHSGRDRLLVMQQGIKVHTRTYEGHSLTLGWRNVKKDAKCYSRDLFGWVMQPDNPPATIETGNECVVDRLGLSWVLLPLALLFPMIGAVTVVGARHPERRSYAPRNWLALLMEFARQAKWPLMIGLLALCMILINVFYWIGHGVYSARYLFEATAIVAMLSGAGVSALARLADRVRLRFGVYALLAIAVGMSAIGYSPNRLAYLKGHGNISRDPIEQVEQMRYTSDTPVLVIVSGEHHWREFATFMGITDPYATNDIIGLRDPDQNSSQLLMDRYPDRQVIFLVNEQLIPIDIQGRAGYDQEPPPAG